MANADLKTEVHPELTLWMVDPLTQSEWPQGDCLIHGMCLQKANEQVAALNDGRGGLTERYVLRGKDNNPIFA